MPVVITEPVAFTPALLDAMAPWLSPDHAIFLSALGQMFEPVAELVYDQGRDGDPDYVPGWGRLLDVDLCPDRFLPFLAQFNGTVIPSGALPAVARQVIRAESGMLRGTPGAIVSAAQRSLSGAQSCVLLERTAADGTPDPYHFVLVVHPSEVISESTLITDVDAMKPGGVMWTLIQQDAWTWAEATGTWAADAMSWADTAAERP